MNSRSPSHDFGASYQEGIVSAIDAAKHRVRVTFPALDNLQSDWLAVRADYAHGNKDYAIPDVGTLVGCILDARGESGMVLGGIYNASDQPPANNHNLWVKQFADGTRIEHNRSSGKLSIKVSGDFDLTAGGNVKIQGTKIDLN